MKHLKQFKIFESGNWWEEKLKDYHFDKDEIRDYFNYVSDEFGISPYIEFGFWDANFQKISKKLDVVERKFYPGYYIRLQTLNTRKVKELIDFNNYINNALQVLDRDYKCQVFTGGGYYTLICLDETQEFDSESVEFKGKKSPKIIGIDNYLEILNKHSKLLMAQKIEDNVGNRFGGDPGDYILIAPLKKEDFEKTKNIVNKIFSKQIENDFIRISDVNSKIVNSNISRTGWRFVEPNESSRRGKEIKSLKLKSLVL